MVDLKGVFFSLFLFFSIQQPIIWMFGIAWSWIELLFFFFQLTFLGMFYIHALD